MNGISLTVLKLNDSNKEEVLSYLDLPVDSPFWPGVVNMQSQTQNVIALGRKQEVVDSTDFSASDNEQTKKFRAGFKNVLDQIVEKADELTKQDSDVGDGDLGIGASRAAKSTLKMINNLDFQNNLQSAFIQFSDVFSDGFGGSSGPLWGVFISKGAT